MKQLILLLFVAGSLAACSQNKNNDEQQLIERTYLLSHTVFGTKDSATLEDLFAKQATYGHSHGNLQNRKQAIEGAFRNKSTYIDTAVKIISVIVEGDAAVVRHYFKANEIKQDGSVVPLDFLMMLAWVKENGEWKLMGRQAVALNR